MSDIKQDHAVNKDDAAPVAAPVAAAVPEAPDRQPVLFLSHGGGPGFFMDIDPSSPYYDMSKGSAAAAWFQRLAASEKLAPRALLVLSAHWESPDSSTVLINNKAQHSLYYDYGGFPEFTYRLQWPVKGDPVLAQRVADLLQAGGFKTRFETKRGLDHGVFIPLMQVFPDAKIPVVQVSLLPSLDPDTHLRLGASLAALRDQGVLIIGSGFATHGFRASAHQNLGFANWLANTISSPSKEKRWSLLTEVENAPHYHAVHPRSEHLIPVHIAVGAAGDDAGKVIGQFDANKGATACLHSYRFG